MNVLYISYDGLTDPLGSSQITPYVLGLKAAGHKVTVISCEKPARMTERAGLIGNKLQAGGVKWEPLKYHKSPPIFSTLYDLSRIKRKAFELHRQEKFDVVHCRSYISALVGLEMKRRFGVKFLFDMRGFWADERIDGGMWPQSNPIYKVIYKYFKGKERLFLESADAIVSLTHAGKEEMLKWPVGVKSEKVHIIPCCVDLKRFSGSDLDAGKISAVREQYGKDRLVLTYLGSLGTWYLLKEMLEFFKRVTVSQPDALLAVITPEPKDMVINEARRLGIASSHLFVQSAPPEDVPYYLAAADIGLYFIKPCYSKMSSSPIKLGELLAMGLPVITNAGVGDSDAILGSGQIGCLIKEFSQQEYDRAVAQIPALLKIDKSGLRQYAQTHFSLQAGLDQYKQIYQKF
jgi:glycosyltransferase involved in cell wall biosynthesis